MLFLLMCFNLGIGPVFLELLVVTHLYVSIPFKASHLVIVLQCVVLWYVGDEDAYV